MILSVWRVKSDNKEKKSAQPVLSEKLIKRNSGTAENDRLKKLLEKMLKN